MLWFKRIFERLRPARTLAARTFESAALLYDLRHKPRIVLYWLKTAVRAHALFIVFVAPLCLGISLASRAGLFNFFLWTTGLGVITARLMADLRGSIGYSTRTARSLIKEADAACERDPARSLELYQSAAELTCYPGDETALLERIREVEKEIAAGRRTDRTTTAVVTAASPRAPRQVGERYTNLSEIGRGASGTVYRADDLVLDRAVALKELTMTVTDDDTRTRFRREAKILARLNHPNIVQVFDLFEHGGRLWIAMELVEGGDLEALLSRKYRLDHAAATHLGERMAEALAFAHDRGVIHRDLKPLNVLLVNNKTPKITDFGLAKLSEGNVHTIEGMVLGSPRYMSPEQAEGKPASERSDIYSLGIMLYHMLAGKPPFEGDTKSLLMQHIRRNSKPLQEVVPDLPPETASLVDLMLSKDPADRPADMTAVARRLRSSLETIHPV